MILRILVGLSLVSGVAKGDSLTVDVPKVNKLHSMYQFFYLPFPLEFKVGRNLDAVLPYLTDARGETTRLIEAHELVSLDAQWTKVRQSWKKKSLLEFNQVPVGKSLRITQKLVSHRVPLQRSALDSLAASDKAALSETLKGKSPDVIASFYQLRWVKSLLEASDEGKFNFFIVSASWCESSREYRNLLEAYFKRFPSPDLILHSIVFEDPHRKVFDSRALKELFPHPKRYSHDTIPRFLAFENVNGQPRIYEEGEALQALYDRFYAQHRGFLKSDFELFKRNQANPLLPAISSASR